MGKQQITNLNVGNATVLDQNTKLIRFEGSNEDFFWRVAGELTNKKCEVVVPPTHQVIFVKDGVYQKVFGNGRYHIFEKRKGLLGLFGAREKALVDVIYLNKTIKFNAKWGTKDPLLMRDPITELPVHLKGYGEFEVGINDPEKFYLQIAGADHNFTLDTLRERLYVRVMSFFRDCLLKTMRSKIMNYMDIQYFMKDVGDTIAIYLNEAFVKDCGLNVCSFTIANISLEDDEMEMIEKELATMRKEMKEKKNKEDIVNELERLEDRANARKDYEEEAQWQRELILKQLEMADKEKYYEVLKILAEHSQNKFSDIDIKKTIKIPAKHDLHCPKCGEKVPEGSKFCPKCGKEIGKKIDKCPKCGEKVPEGSKFCPKCGKEL